MKRKWTVAFLWGYSSSGGDHSGPFRTRRPHSRLTAPAPGLCNKPLAPLALACWLIPGTTGTSAVGPVAGWADVSTTNRARVLINDVEQWAVSALHEIYRATLTPIVLARRPPLSSLERHSAAPKGDYKWGMGMGGILIRLLPRMCRR
jgi:hypothetical protein